MNCKICGKDIGVDGSYLLEECRTCANKIIRNRAMDELVNKMKNEYFHRVGTQFDNAILEMEKMAERLKQ